MELSLLYPWDLTASTRAMIACEGGVVICGSVVSPFANAGCGCPLRAWPAWPAWPPHQGETSRWWPPL
eukprot:1193330-Prorocentrum_minimum.AAC.3